MHARGIRAELQEMRALTNSCCSGSYLFLIHPSPRRHNQEKILWMGISVREGMEHGREIIGKGQAKRRLLGWAVTCRTPQGHCPAPSSHGQAAHTDLLGKEGLHISVLGLFCIPEKPASEIQKYFPLWDYLRVSPYSYLCAYLSIYRYETRIKIKTNIFGKTYKQRRNLYMGKQFIKDEIL